MANTNLLNVKAGDTLLLCFKPEFLNLQFLDPWGSITVPEESASGENSILLFFDPLLLQDLSFIIIFVSSTVD
jgi:hypothetical protein